jgi:hypothetical protein
MRVATLGVAAAIFATFVVAAGAARVATGGVYGTVIKSPTTPVCKEGVPCSAPAVGVTIQALRGTSVVAHAVTDTQGRYRFRLAPGRYTLRVVRTFRPQAVPVVVGTAWVRRNVLLDTGIRGPSASPVA